MSYLLSGIEYATKHARPGHTIINLSLSGGKSEALDKTVEATYNAGIPIIVAAGNEQVDACDGSPSGTPTAFTVGAADRNDVTAEFSNYGACVRLFAPGVDIASWWIGTEPTTRIISGTSMAAPHVAGAAAVLLSVTKSKDPETIYEKLLQWATNGTITRQPDDYTSPTRLLYLPHNISDTSIAAAVSNITNDKNSTFITNNITLPNVTTPIATVSPITQQEKKTSSAVSTQRTHNYEYYPYVLFTTLVYFFLAF
jgi:subtilisin family serine protease